MPAPNAAIRPEPTTYPCELPIKVTGINHPSFKNEVVALAQTIDPSICMDKTEERTSSSGKYLGLTLFFRAESREHLQLLYQKLANLADVKWVM